MGKAFTESNIDDWNSRDSYTNDVMDKPFGYTSDCAEEEDIEEEVEYFTEEEDLIGTTDFPTSTSATSPSDSDYSQTTDYPSSNCEKYTLKYKKDSFAKLLNNFIDKENKEHFGIVDKYEVTDQIFFFDVYHYIKFDDQY